MRIYTDPRSPFLFFDFSYKGKRYRGSTFEKTKSAASRVATNHLARLMAGDPVEKRGQRFPTLQEFSARFFLWADNSSTLQPNTRKYYGYGWRLLSFSILANTPVDQIDAELIDTVRFKRPVLDRKTGHSTDTWIACGQTYTQQALRTLRVMLGMAHKWKVITGHVSFKILKTPGRCGLITPEIEAIILCQLSGYRNRRPWLVVMTLMDTGARPSEVFEMRLEHIDWVGHRIWIPKGKTDNSARWVGMSERMHLELSSWCQGSEGPGWLFPARTRNSKTGHFNTIAKSFKAACIRGGLDVGLVPYLARHTFGTLTMRETGNTFAVMKAMGHASVLSMAPYQHQETAQLLEVINARNSTGSSKR